MTPTEARAYNLACRDIVEHIEREFVDLDRLLINDICADIHAMRITTAYQVTHFTEHHAKQEAVEID